MKVINSKQMSVIFNSMALHLTLVIGTMSVTGFIVGFLSKVVLFWLPSVARRQVIASMTGLGALLGLWIGVKFFA